MALFRMMAVAMLMIAAVCLPFVFGAEEKPKLAHTPDTTANRSTADTVGTHVASETELQTDSAKSLPHAVPAKASKASAPVILEQEMIIYSDAQDSDIYIAATVSYEKTGSGEYKVLSCKYEPVSDSGKKVFFVPDDEIRYNISATMANIDINGTLTYEDADGQPVEKYVSVNQMVFR